MKHFGYFVTESSGHASEYVPYFRKSAAMVNEQLVPNFTDKVNDWFDYGRTGGYLRHCLERIQKFQREFEEILSAEPVTTRSHEYGSYIIEAMESHAPICINGNVPNLDLIDNLPRRLLRRGSVPGGRKRCSTHQGRHTSPSIGGAQSDQH